MSIISYSLKDLKETRLRHETCCSRNKEDLANIIEMS